MNQLENCQARYRSNTWMGRTRTDGPDDFEPRKFDCIYYLDLFSQNFNIFFYLKFSGIDNKQVKQLLKYACASHTC